MTHGSTVAVLLAAGAGTRLGRGPKALLPDGRHGGRPLVEHGARVLLDGGCDVVVVVLGAEADRVRTEARLGSARDGGSRTVVVDNPGWESGMAGSLQLGIATALATDPGTARVVVAHVDQPGVAASDVARLLAAHRAGRVTASRWATAAERRRWSHPLVLDASLAAPAAASAHGDQGARDFLRAHAELIDVVEHPGDGRDLDTEADLDLLT